MIGPSPVNGRVAALFAASGEVGRLLARYDWVTSPVGSPENWPETLVSALNLMLPAGAEIVLFWGPEYCAFYNDAYAPTIGDKHPSALGRPAHESWSELWDDLEPMLRHVRDTGETFSARDRPFYIERSGYGEEVYFDISYSAVRLPEGAIGGVLCIVSETTERVRAARTLQEDRARLSQMFDQAPGFMAVLRQPGNVIELANESYQQLVGERDLIGKQLHTALPEIAHQGFIELLDQVVESGEPYRGENVRVTLQRASGQPPEERVLDFIYQPITDAEGHTSAVFVEGVDVTERERRAEALRESEARFRLLADSLPALVWINDAEGRIIFANQAFHMLLGMAPGDLREKGWGSIVHRDDLPGFQAYGRRRLAQPKSFSRDVRLCHADGSVRWFHIEARPRKLGGSFEGYVGCGLDVSDAHAAGEALERRVEERTAELIEQIAERERVEATLAQMQRLEAVGQLTSGVAHDFNNLLTVVLGNMSMIERAVETAGIDGKTKQRLGHVRVAAERGAKLTAQLLAFSRRQRLETKVVSLNDVIRGMQDLLHSTLGGGVAIETNLAPQLWSALVDPTQIELVILNLAINARDAMDVGGTLSVSTENATLGAPARSEEPSPGEYVAVRVTDTGSGMTEEVAAKAFEPFFTTKDVGKGSGLGLAQVYGFAKQSGGGVRIDSQVGRGTRVSVFLPRAARAAEEATSIRSERISTEIVEGRTVLVLDDDDAVRSVTVEELRAAGCVVVEASNGTSALAQLDENEGIEAVVADFAMPGMNGAEFARRALAKRREIPIIFVTGYADLAALSDVPDEDVIQKPYPAGAIVERLGTLFELKQTRADSRTEA